MTFLGKLLTMLNVVLSLTILAVALASFSNPVDFSDNPAKGEEPAGMFKQRADAIARAWVPIPDALDKLVKAQDSLVRTEQYNNSHVWFKKELEHLETGSTKEAAIQSIKKNGALPEVDAKNADRLVLEPLLELGQPLELKSRAEYEAESALAIAAYQKAQDRYLAAVEQDIRETTRRLQHKDVNGAEELGLFKRLTDEEFKLRQAKEEIARIEPLLINALVESALVLERRLALESRMQELKRLEKNSAVGRVDR